MRKAIIFVLAFFLLLPLAKADVFFTNQNPPNLAQRDNLHPFLNASIQPYSNVSTSLNCSLYVDNVLNQTVNDIANNTVVYLNSSTLLQGDHSWYINCTDNNWATQAQSEVRTIGIGSSFSRCGVLIDEYGSYQLTADIINSGASACISIPNNHIILDCQGHTIDGTDIGSTYGIYVYRSSPTITNITIKNCILTDWDYGIYFYRSGSNVLSNITANSNYYGVWLQAWCTSNVLSNITANYNQYYGFLIYDYSDSNILSNITANSNGYRGISLEFSNSNIIKDSVIKGNGEYGIYMYWAGQYGSNLFYNNLFNNTNNIGFGGAIYANNWNTTRQVGTRIYSAGTEIGGNYWTNATGNSYSDICRDTEGDGFCDSPYTLATDNIDYLPYSKWYGSPTWGAPRWSNNSTFITYGDLSVFNITWDDSPGYSIDTVLFESNFSGTPTNYTMTLIDPYINETEKKGVYSFNDTLPTGTFYWKSYAQASDGTWNSTDTWYFTITPPTTTTLPPVHGVPLLSSTLVGIVIGVGIITFMLRTLFDINAKEIISNPEGVVMKLIALAVIVTIAVSLIVLFA